MCQLLGMNCNKPATLQFSLEGFVQRGGGTDEHRDGWGIGYFDGDGAHVFRDANPAATSPACRYCGQRFRSRNIIAHIRKATQGEIRLENCHPFRGRLWGRDWLFAHNGNLEGFRPPLAGRQPQGTTDSEHAFHYLLEQLTLRFGDIPPALADLRDALHTLSERIARHGTFNYLLSCGERMFAHCSTDLHYVVRAYPFRSARLLDCDRAIDFARHNHLDDRMAVVTTRPLTADEDWHRLPAGSLTLFADGQRQDDCVRPREVQLAV
ncbi:hypothetical protein dqs_2423 [Azoarcus olearius]|nr:hypothetical protein dqs_2423 [Azoarcus olearius]